MKFEARRVDDSEERILPLINVVFLLLIFFMIAGSLSVTEPLAIEPPHSNSNTDAHAEHFVILLDREGKFALAGVPVTQSDLFSRLSTAARSAVPPIIQIKADSNVVGNEVVHLLEQLREIGIEKVQLLTVPEAL